MSSARNIAVIVGSLRKESFNRKLALNLIELAPSTLALGLVEIGALPLYNLDLETAEPPAGWSEFRERIRGAQGLLFVTPEFNRSVPGALKNAIDVGSRPWGKNVFTNKPTGVISGSTGPISGFGANHHLRQSLVTLNALTMAQPEAYLSGIDKLFDASGKIANDSTREFLTKYLVAFAAWVDKLA